MQTNSESKSKPQRILGIDFGLKRIGLALSDDNQIIAFALPTLEAEKQSEQTALKLLKFIQTLQETNAYEIQEMVIGLPLLMNGKAGLLADEVQHFISLIKGLSSIPISAWDERLSTVQAERSLREGKMTRKKRSKVVDKVSAVIILQSYLDSKTIKKTTRFNTLSL